jgi:hypothetical protein
MSRLSDLGVLEKISTNQVFEDVDRAIEWAEDNLLGEVLDEPLPTEEMPLDQVGVLYNLDPGDIAALKERLTRVIKLLANLGRELSGRLRRADRMIDELEM